MTNFKPTDQFLQLLKNTTAFSPEPDEDDLHQEKGVDLINLILNHEGLLTL